MVEKTSVIKTSFYNILLQLVMIPMNFILQWVMLEYIGVELVGIKNTVKSLVGVLSLAEGGVGSAITYCLYKPVVEHDYEKINQLMAVFKKVYGYIALFILVAGVLLSFFLPVFLRSVEINGQVYIIFALECLNAAISYLFCYRRNLLLADLKNYVATRVDIVCNIIFISIGIILVLCTRNYVFYLLVMIGKTIISNLIIHFYSKKMYGFLKKTSANREVMKRVLEYSKNLVFGNIASYIYNSTDNLVISSFTNTQNVGCLSNYTMISNYLKTFVVAAFSGIAPSVGQQQACSTAEEKGRIFFKYNQLCHFVATLICVPTLVLLDDFVCSVYGAQYQMGTGISWLLAIILYLWIASFAYGDFISTGGLFKELKRIEIVGAVTNIVTSVVLVLVMGIEGVLLGTVITTLVQIWMRNYYLCRKVLLFDRFRYLKFAMKQFYLSGIAVLDVILAKVVGSLFLISFFPARFFAKGMSSVLIVGVVYLCFYRFEDKMTINDFKRVLYSIVRRRKTNG